MTLLMNLQAPSKPSRKIQMIPPPKDPALMDPPPTMRQPAVMFPPLTSLLKMLQPPKKKPRPAHALIPFATKWKWDLWSFAVVANASMKISRFAIFIAAKNVRRPTGLYGTGPFTRMNGRRDKLWEDFGVVCYHAVILYYHDILTYHLHFDHLCAICIRSENEQ